MFTIITIAKNSHLIEDVLPIFKTKKEAEEVAMKSTLEEIESLSKDCSKNEILCFEDDEDSLGAYTKVLCIKKRPFSTETLTTRFIRELKEK